MQATLGGRRIDAVLVDAGGVLVDPNWDTVSAILGRHGVTADPEALRAAEPFAKREIDEPGIAAAPSGEPPRERFVARVLRHAGIPADPSAVEAAGDEIDAYHREHGLWEVVLLGVREALDALRAAGLRLSLASNTERLYRAKLGELGLAQRLDFLAISDELGVAKPDPRFFLIALEALGVAPEHAVHVGDFYEFDVVGARSAGVAPVLVDVAGLSADREVPRIGGLNELPALLGLDLRHA